MTDKQRAIFQKIIEGKVWQWTWNDGYVEVNEDGYIRVIARQTPDWNDYNEAWKAYEAAPLIMALK